MWQGIDRRKFPRVHYPCKVNVFQKGYQEAFSTQTENIGAGGICVILDKGLGRFSAVELTIYLVDGQPPIRCDARVVWVVNRQAKFDIGIEFINLKEQDTLRIERIVQICLNNLTTSSEDSQI